MMKRSLKKTIAGFGGGYRRISLLYIQLFATGVLF